MCIRDRYYNSADPQQAATILNALAKSYINLNLERRFDASAYARNVLQGLLQQVKAKLEDSERELVEFARQQQIYSVDEKQSIVTRNLEATNAALGEAEKRRISAEVVYRQMLSSRGQNLSQVQNNPMAVSYTHLDVYKRQVTYCPALMMARQTWRLRSPWRGSPLPMASR